MEVQETMEQETIIVEVTPSDDEVTESFETETFDESEETEETTETQVTTEEEETATEQQEIMDSNSEPLQQITTTEVEIIDYSEQLETIIEQQENIYNDLHNTTQLFQYGFSGVCVIFIVSMPK